MSFKPKSAIVSVVIALFIYLYLGSIVASTNVYSPENPVLVYIVYLMISMMISFVLLKSDISELEQESNTFKRVSPFDKYGDIIHDFQYSFKADSSDVISETHNLISNNLRKYSGFSDIKVETITDIDKKLTERDERDFIVCQSEKTLRGGKVTYLLKSDNTGSMYSIKWWFLLSGVITKASMVIPPFMEQSKSRV